MVGLLFVTFKASTCAICLLFTLYPFDSMEKQGGVCTKGPQRPYGPVPSLHRWDKMAREEDIHWKSTGS